MKLPRAAAAAVGVSPSAVRSFVHEVEARKLDMHSFMVVRHGKVAAEGWWQPYGLDKKHMLFSLSKSFTSTAAGFAIQEGLLSLDDPVLKFFPDLAPASPSENLQKMKVRHLLSMSCGHDAEPQVYMQPNWIKPFLAHPVPHEPGTHFAYNTPGTFMVAAILNRVTGKDLVDYLKPRLFDPLDIDGNDWEFGGDKVRAGGYGLSITTEDIAKFGIFILQKGVWNGDRLLGSTYINQATRKQVSNGDDPHNEWNQGYGFQFWMCTHGAFRGDGAYGQFCVVLPEKDAIVAITSGLDDLGGVLALIWETLLPGMKDDRILDAVEDLSFLKALKMRMPDHVISPVEVEKTVYQFRKNEPGLKKLELSAGKDGVDLVLHGKKANTHMVAPFGAWGPDVNLELGAPSSRAGAGKATQPCSGSAGWLEKDLLAVKLCFTRTPFTPTLKIKLAGDSCSLTLEGATSLWGTRSPEPLVGKKIG